MTRAHLPKQQCFKHFYFDEIMGTSDESEISSDEVYEYYVDWCKKRKGDWYSENAFIDAMKIVGYNRSTVSVKDTFPTVWEFEAFTGFTLRGHLLN